MKLGTKRVLAAVFAGALAALLIRIFQCEAMVLRYLGQLDLVAATGWVADWQGRLAQGNLGVLVSILGAAFALVAGAVFTLSATPAATALLTRILPERPPFLRRPERQLEPLLAQLGVTRPLSFFGRTAEMAKLDVFAEQNGKFLWWSMHGTGGVGKTRLAAEWMLKREIEHPRLDIGFLSRETISLEALRRFRPRRDTLIAIDDALLFAPELWDYLVTLAGNAEHFRHAVRVLLIDWPPLDRPPNDALARMDALAVQLLNGSRHYEMVMEERGTPAAFGGQSGPAARPLPAVEMVEVPELCPSLGLKPLTDRSVVAAILADAGGDDAALDVDEILAATDGNPLLVVASGLHPGEPPQRIIEGLARKMLARAGDADNGGPMSAILSIAALAGPIPHKAYQEFTRRTAKPAKLIEYFPLPPSALQSSLPSLEPELVAHEVILQHMSCLTEDDQHAFAQFAFNANRAKALRATGNLWMRRPEAHYAAALATGTDHLLDAREASVVYARALNVLAGAAEGVPEFASSQVPHQRGLRGIALLRGMAVQPASRSADADSGSEAHIQDCPQPDDLTRIVRFTLTQVSGVREEYEAVYRELPLEQKHVAILADALLTGFVLAEPSKDLAELFADGAQMEAVLQMLSDPDHVVAASAALRVMYRAYLRSSVRFQPGEIEAANRIVEPLCDAVERGPDSLRIAASWALRWICNIPVPGGQYYRLTEARASQVLAGLADARALDAAGFSMQTLGLQVRRDARTKQLIDWAAAIDASQAPPTSVTETQPFVSPLHEPLVAELRRRVAGKNVRNKIFLRRLGGVAVSIDLLDREFRRAILEYLRDTGATGAAGFGAISRIATSAHPGALDILRDLFRKGDADLRLLAFLGLWARGDGSFATEHPRDDDLVDYARLLSEQGQVEYLRALESRLGEHIHKLKARDTTGRWAYYFVLVPVEQDRAFLDAIEGDGTIDLDDYGKVIASCYGEIPTQEVRTMLRDRYGFET